MTPRQLRNAARGTIVAERDLTGGDVNQAINRYASFGWEAVDIAGLRKTYSLTGGLLFYRHRITIMFRKVANDAVRAELLAEPMPGAVPAPVAHRLSATTTRPRRRVAAV